MYTPTIESRIERLERQVSRQRLVITGLVTVCLVLGAGSTIQYALAAEDEVAEVVKARAFHVVDDEGVLLAEVATLGGAGIVATYAGKDLTQTAMGSGDEGGGYITCFNKKGEIQVNLGGDQDGGQVVTHAASGNPRVLLSGDEKGGTVSTFNAEGMPTQLR